MRLFSALCLLAIAGLATAGPVGAATKVVRLAPAGSAIFTDNNVSIMSEAQPATSSGDADNIGVLASAYAQAGLPRILAVRGLGPLANMRDLLRMRGIDMAVLNGDVLAYAHVTGEMAGADARLSAIAKLYDKIVYVIAGPSVHAITDLAGKKVLVPGEGSDSYVSARTLLGLLSVHAELGSTSLEEAIGALDQGSADAIVLTLRPGDPALAQLPRNKGLHVLPVPVNEAVAKVYTARSLAAAETPGLTPEGDVATVQVATLLATFNWRPYHARYAPILDFLRSMPQAVALLRKSDQSGVWLALDGRAEVQGWQRFEPARPPLATIAPLTTEQPAPTIGANTSATASLDQMASQAASAGTGSSAATGTLPVTTPVPVPVLGPPMRETIEVSAHPMPGLADARVSGGGLMVELVMAGLEREHTKLDWSEVNGGVDATLTGVKAPRIGLAWPRPDCEHRDGLPAATVAACDQYVFSKPVFQSLQVFFTRHGSDFTFERDEQVAGRSICAASDTDLSALDASGRQWLRQDLVTLLRRPTLADCLTALDHGDVEAVFAEDFSGRAEIDRLQFDDRIDVGRRAVATLDYCAIADKANALAVEAIHRLDAGLAAIKTQGRYADIIVKHLGHVQLSSQQSLAP